MASYQDIEMRLGIVEAKLDFLLQFISITQTNNSTGEVAQQTLKELYHSNLQKELTDAADRSRNAN